MATSDTDGSVAESLWESSVALAATHASHQLRNVACVTSCKSLSLFVCRENWRTFHSRLLLLLDFNLTSVHHVKCISRQTCDVEYRETSRRNKIWQCRRKECQKAEVERFMVQHGETRSQDEFETFFFVQKKGCACRFRGAAYEDCGQVFNVTKSKCI